MFFFPLTQARKIVETWRGESNESRPPKALGKKTLDEFGLVITASPGLIALQSARKPPWTRFGRGDPVTEMRSLSA
jgi:hypothetical protein